MYVHVRVPVRLSDGMPCIHGEKLAENQQKQGTNCAHRSREWLMQMSMSHREHHKRLFHGAPRLKRNSHHYIAEIFTRATVSTQLPLAKAKVFASFISLCLRIAQRLLLVFVRGLHTSAFFEEGASVESPCANPADG